MLTVIDEYTRECLAIVVDRRLRSTDVIEAMAELFIRKGLPEHIRSDYGTEFTSNHFDQWAYKLGIQLDLIALGRPAENAFIENFNGKLCDECLNMHWFETLIELWRVEYNETRPHSSLGNRAPADYVAELLGVGTSP